MRLMGFRGWLLWAGIILNLGLGGFLITRAMNAPCTMQRPAAEYEGQPLMELLALEALSEDERERVRSVISERLPELRAAGDLAEQAYERFAGTFEREPFDPQSANEAAEALREARETQWQIAARIYVDAYATLPESARAEMLATRGRHLMKNQSEAHQ